MTTLLKTPVTIAATQPNRETINHDRRKLIASAAMGLAAAGAASLFPVRPAPAATNDAIRPFSINIPEADLVDLHRRLAETRWPEKGDGRRRLPGRATGDVAKRQRALTRIGGQ
jgi:hypothetical protein